MDISVIVATYNRCADLKDSIESILNQQANGSFTFECIVVDNNSSDQTKNLVTDYTNRHKGRLRYVLQQKPGVSAARNKGINVASGNILVFTDDDVIVPPNWISDIYRAFQQDNTLEALFGSALLIKNKEDIQSVLQEASANRNLFMHDCQGLNMAFRKQVFFSIGYFDECLGSGSPGRSAEDYDFLYRLQKNQKKIQYFSTLYVYHKTRPNKKIELKLLHRDAFGRGFYFAKNIILNKDYTFIRRSAGYIKYLIVGFFNCLFTTRLYGLYTSMLKLEGFFDGLLRGIVFWIYRRTFKTTIIR